MTKKNSKNSYMRYKLEEIKQSQTPKVRNDFDDDDVLDSENVEKEDNRIYFYSEVNRNTVLKLNTTIQQVSKSLIYRSTILEQSVGNMFLHINSMGGSLFDGLIASDYIRTSKVPIYSIIDGSAASAATLMSVVAKKRMIHKNSFMLIHQLSTQAWGTFANLKDEMHNSSILMDTLKNIYKEYTKIPNKKLEQILTRDLWLTSKECLEMGLVDEIIE